MAEQVFLDEQGIQVTDKRFIVKGHTYAINSIASIRAAEKEGKLTLREKVFTLAAGWIFPGGFSLGCFMFHQYWLGLFFACFPAWITWLVVKDKNFKKGAVILLTLAGEVTALEDISSEFIAKVCLALNNAIVAKG